MDAIKQKEAESQGRPMAATEEGAGLTPVTRNRPWLTHVMMGLCILAFLGFHLDQTEDAELHYLHWGAVSPDGLRRGWIWGLFTSCFLHVEIWHLILNLSGLWVFGRHIELLVGRRRYLLAVFTGGVVSSLGELIVDDTTGIGMSGALYALAGLVLVQMLWDRSYRGVISKVNIVILLAWIPVGFVLTHLGWMAIGNMGHLSGLCWGAVLGILPRIRHRWMRLAFALLPLIPLTSWFWHPQMSPSWHARQAYDLHSRMQLDEAMMHYDWLLARNPDDEFALGNTKVIRNYRMQMDAQKAYERGNPEVATRLCRQLLAEDPKDEFASYYLSLAMWDSTRRASMAAISNSP